RGRLGHRRQVPTQELLPDERTARARVGHPRRGRREHARLGEQASTLRRRKRGLLKRGATDPRDAVKRGEVAVYEAERRRDEGAPAAVPIPDPLFKETRGLFGRGGANVE